MPDQSRTLYLLIKALLLDYGIGNFGNGSSDP